MVRLPLPVDVYRNAAGITSGDGLTDLPQALNSKHQKIDAYFSVERTQFEGDLPKVLAAAAEQARAEVLATIKSPHTLSNDEMKRLMRGLDVLDRAWGGKQAKEKPK